MGTARGAPDAVANTSDASSSATDETATTSQSAQATAASASNELTTIGSTDTSGKDEQIDASSITEDSALDAELPADETSAPPGTKVGATATSGSPSELEDSTGDEFASTDGYAGIIDEEVVSPSASAGTDPANAGGPTDNGIAGADTEVPVDTAAVVSESGAAAQTDPTADAESGTPSRSPGVVAAVASPDIAETALEAVSAVAVSAVPEAAPEAALDAALDAALENDEPERAAPLADSDHWPRAGATPAAGTAAAPPDGAEVPVVPGSVPVIKRVLAGVLGLFGVEAPSGEAPLNPFAPDFLTQLAFAAWQRVRFLLGDTATTTSPTIVSTDPAVDSSPNAAAALAVAAPSASASYTLTAIDFDSGLVSGVLDVDPVAVARYEVSGGFKGTVTFVDNAFEYRPTAQAQEAASAPDAGYEALYDNFDVLAIGIGGAATGSATKIHVDVPVLGASALASSQF